MRRDMKGLARLGGGVIIIISARRRQKKNSSPARRKENRGRKVAANEMRENEEDGKRVEMVYSEKGK